MTSPDTLESIVAQSPPFHRPAVLASVVFFSPELRAAFLDALDAAAAAYPGCLGGPLIGEVSHAFPDHSPCNELARYWAPLLAYYAAGSA